MANLMHFTLVGNFVEDSMHRWWLAWLFGLAKWLANLLHNHVSLNELSLAFKLVVWCLSLDACMKSNEISWIHIFHSINLVSSESVTHTHPNMHSMHKTNQISFILITDLQCFACGCWATYLHSDWTFQTEFIFYDFEGNEFLIE